MFVLTDDAGRVSVCYDRGAPAETVEVAEPEGWDWEHIGDWVLQDGVLVYEPLPVEDVPEVDETALLKAQVQALSERGEFLEDCIAEMAMLVYGGV